MDIMTRFTTGIATALSALIAKQAGAQQPTAEVVHHWVSASESAALGKIREKLSELGVGFKDSAVGGLSGVNATQALRARLVAGNAPTAMQMYGFEPLIWAEEGVVVELDEVAGPGGWDTVVPDALKALTKYEDRWIAAPVNMHRTNWIWGNAKLFRDNDISELKSWDDVIAAGNKLKEAGVVPIAASDEPWQIALLFDALLADLNGPDFYRKATLDLDEQALRSPEMIATFAKLREIQQLTDENIVGRDWAVASDMVTTGQAGMQIMGDWAKGEFLGKGLKAGEDFLCLPTPGQQETFTFVSDVITAFQTNDDPDHKAAYALATATMDLEAQKQFNLLKGSIPARTDIDLTQFDDCAKAAAAAREDAVANNALLGSLSNSMVTRPEFTAVFSEVGAQFFLNPSMTPEQAVESLVSGIDNAR